MYSRKPISGIMMGLLAVSTASAALKNVLIYSNTAGYRHGEGIADGSKMMDSLAIAKGFVVVKTEDPNQMTYANLKKYDLIVFNNTTGAVLPNAVQQNDFIKYLNEGGGYLGFHGAMDHHGYWQWYTDQGVDFSGHSTGQPNCQVDTAAAVRKPEYADIVKVFPKTPWVWDEEWYAFKENPRRNSDVILTVDESSNKWVIPAALRMGDHPIAWAHKLPPLPGSTRQGHYFYTLMGHGGIGGVFKRELYVNEFFYQAMRWAAGEMDGAAAAVNPSRFLSKTKSGAVSFQAGQVDVSVSETGPHSVEVLDMRGRRVAGGHGNLPGTYVFPHLASGSIYVIRVQAAHRLDSRRVVVQ